MKRALIIGVNGMDGSYLADILLAKGTYDVHGIIRRSSHDNLWRIATCLDRLTIHKGDVTDPISLERIIKDVAPDEIYNEADQDHVGFSFETPRLSVDVTYGAVATLLEILSRMDGIKLFQPLSATMFGNAEAPQTLETPFDPQSPYACAKVAAYYLCKHYREKFDVQVYTGILYNHDSVRRQGDYLLHHICKGAVRIKHGDQSCIVINNLETKVDIGSAREFMEVAHRILQCFPPGNWLIGTGESLSIQEMVEIAFEKVGINDWKKHVGVNINAEKTYPELRAWGTWSEITKYIPDLIHELCHHYETKLYGAAK